MRPIRMPDAHLPNSATEPWTCRTCASVWPCERAREYLDSGRCQCGAPSWWEQRGPRSWHVGPRCYTPRDRLLALAEDARQARAAHPHYPPSHYYPAKPRRAVRQRPPFEHTPAAAGDVKPGTWLWVKPGGLHPGWGDIHRFAMLTAAGTPKCEVWLHCDGTVHQVRAELLILDLSGWRTRLDAIRGRRMPDEWGWLRWTVARHLDHARPAPAEAEPEPEQEALFA
ncbi:hypothetical protein [Streptomyces sp. NPDC053560]|uniref:hypothetical protein n=1 Tax=Streptomyces sp. NPDC053560 TaxID=3365711 RepID=UPI0037D3BB69